MFSDGEYRRGGWASDFQDAFDGYVPGSPPVVMSWLSAQLDKPSRLITQADVKRLLAK